MSVATTVPVTERGGSPGAEEKLKQLVFGVLAVTVLLSPMLYRHTVQLMAREHYQFVVLLPVLGILLARRNFQTEQLNDLSVGSNRTTIIAGLSTILVLGIAAFFQSTWLGAAGYLLSLLAIAFAIGGARLVRLLFPAWLMLVFILPLPFELDVILIQDLRRVVTKWSSSVLNLLGVLHLVEGNSIEIPLKAFFVADACTGIHSLFVLLAAAMFFSLLLRRSVLHIFCLLVCSVGLAVLENIVRISGVILAYRNGLDFSEGWRHDLLGLILFSTTCLLLLSADQFLVFLLPSQAFLARILRWNAVRQLPNSTTQESQKSTLSRTIVLIFGGLLAMIGVWQLRQFPVEVAFSSTSKPADVFKLTTFSEDALPSELEGFQRRHYEVINRPTNFGMLAANSVVWNYSEDELNLQLSFDYPYDSIHRLSLCYELIGWTTIYNELIAPPVDPRSPTMVIAPFVHTELFKPVDGSGHLFYSYINTSGEEGVRLYPLRQDPNARELVSHRLKALLGKREMDLQQRETDIKSNAGLSGPVCQVQLLVQLPEKLSDQQRERLERFFVAARGHLKARLQD